MPANSKIDDLLPHLAEQLEEAFNRGYQAGSADTRERIFHAATATPPRSDTKQANRVAGDRAPPGTVRPLVQQILAAEPGLTAADIGRRVTQLDPRVSQTSVTNEVQRNRNKYYRRSKGGRWFPISTEEAQRETAGIATNDPPPMMNGTAG